MVGRGRKGARAALGAALGALLLLAAATPTAAAPEVGDGDGGVRLKLVDRFDQPLYAAAAPGRANRKLLFVVEREGTVRILRGGKRLRRPFLDLRKRVSDDNERGLLSIAFDPDYQRNRRLYAYYTDNKGDIRVDQFRRSKRSKLRANSRARPVIEVRHRDAGNHNGGTVAFGPDGLLYLATGDGGGGCDPNGNAQNPRSLLGKLLRIDPKPKRGYRVPSDNPFAEGGARPEIYASGLRNPYRFAFDERTGTIAIADVGQDAWEEINYETLAGAGGANFGWATFEGTRAADCGGDESTPAPGSHSPPIHEYGHNGGGHTGCSVTGGVVVRDRKLPTLYGRYVFADLCTGELRSLIPQLEGAEDEGAVGIDVSTPTSLVSGRRERLYITSIEGELYRVKAAG